MSEVSTRQSGERLFSLLMLCISSLLFWQAYGIAQFSSLSSPGAVPLATSAIMIISASIVMVNTWKLPADSTSRFTRNILPPLVGIVMGLILIYALILESLGFLLASSAFLFVGFTLLHRSRIHISLGLTLLSLSIIYVVFRLFFQVILPEGIVPEREIMAVITKFFK